MDIIRKEIQKTDTGVDNVVRRSLLGVFRSSVEGFKVFVRHLLENFEVIAPKLEGENVLIGPISSFEDLPAGLKDVHGRGSYRIERAENGAIFGIRSTMYNWKRFLFPPEHVLMRIRKDENGFEVTLPEEEVPERVFLGVRPCDVSAIVALDKVYLGGGTVRDPIYDAHRKKTVIVAVNCTEPAENCFCASVGSGPRALHGADIAITEIVEPEHLFVYEVLSEKGRNIIERVYLDEAGEDELKMVEELTSKAKEKMAKSIDVDKAREAIYANLESPYWEHVGKRCLMCGNCTLVCPTCFCTTIEDRISLDGKVAERIRKWDSCVTLDFSYVHGGSLRKDPASRYRQWMMHKLATYRDQHGVLGCVGCGRCITWCPVGIDITEEAKVLIGQGGEKDAG